LSWTHNRHTRTTSKHLEKLHGLSRMVKEIVQGIANVGLGRVVHAAHWTLRPDWLPACWTYWDFGSAVSPGQSCGATSDRSQAQPIFALL